MVRPATVQYGPDHKRGAGHYQATGGKAGRPNPELGFPVAAGRNPELTRPKRLHHCRELEMVAIPTHFWGTSLLATHFVYHMLAT